MSKRQKKVDAEATEGGNGNNEHAEVVDAVVTVEPADDADREVLDNGEVLDPEVDPDDPTPDPDDPIPDLLARPCFRVFDDWVILNENEKYKPGVWHFSYREKKDDFVYEEKWICSPLHVIAVASAPQGDNFGRLLRFRNTHGQWREWALPMSLLAGSASTADARAVLLDRGVLIDPDAGSLFSQYLMSRTPRRRMVCTDRVGWASDETFVLAGKVVGRDANDYILQSKVHVEPFTTAGTLQEWQENVAKLAINNPIFAICLCCAFAGPLLKRTGQESGGMHVQNSSSKGKSITSMAAASVWGITSVLRSWRATANGLEGAMAASNDAFLVLDEISQCPASEVGEVVYLLGNGQGKQRADRTGGARSVMRSRLFVLSNGELSIVQTIKSSGKRVAAGQEVRMVDVPAARTHGVLDDLHGFPNGGALVEHIKQSAAKFYGTAAIAFLERLSDEPRDLAVMFEEVRSRDEFHVATHEDGQVRRVAAKFALLALAGELATEYGVLPWEQFEANRAAAECFRVWRDNRARSNSEVTTTLEAIEDFVDKHGDSRFVPLPLDIDWPLVRDRAGWREGDTYFFTAGALHEALAGSEFKQSINTLIAEGWLPARGADGKPSILKRIDGRNVRVYPVRVGGGKD